MIVVTNIEEFQVPMKWTVLETAEKMQKLPIKFVFICDDVGRLIGTVTDGDIRRAVLAKVDFEKSIVHIMNRSPKTVTGANCNATILSRMKRWVVKHLPEVDENNKVLRIFVTEHFQEATLIDNPVVIMAGGKGKRLRPYTYDIPKPLITVGGKPVLQWLIEALREEGFWNFFISVNYLAEKIENYFEDGSEWGVKIHYLKEDQPLGTAGCLSLLNNMEKPILMMNGDLITKSKFKKFIEEFDEKKYIAKVGVKEFFYTVPYGCVEVKGNRIKALSEKPVKKFLISAGCYILAPHILEQIEKDVFLDMPCLVNKIIQQDKLVGTFYLEDEWVDIGQMEDLVRARELYKDEEILID